MRALLYAIIFGWISVWTLPVPNIKNLSARYDKPSDSIYVAWNFDENPTGIIYNVRYRILNREMEDDSWINARTTENSLRLNLSDLQNGDEIEVQVRIERGGQIIEDWSQSLIISITKRILIDGLSIDDNDLLPPLDFTANILSPTSVRLEWVGNSQNVPGLYYIVNVKQLTSENNEAFLRQQIKIEANNFAMGNLRPGQRYEMTIRSATGPQRISSTAAIVEITMPTEDEYFEVGNLVISSHFRRDGQGVVNLTWDVPPNMRNKIRAYDVEYSESGSGEWKKLQFSSENPSITLNDLKSDTEYMLKIKTLLYNDLITESGLFKFRTPEVLPNIINKIDVIYTNEANFIRLHWTLEPIVSMNEVAGYDVYLTEDKDLPEFGWKHVVVNSREPALSLTDLKISTVYYVRVNLRMLNGGILRSPSIYRFKTMDHQPGALMEMREPSTLEYRNIGSGQIQITWNHRADGKVHIRGYSILFSDRRDLPSDRWSRIDVNSPLQKSVVLRGLKPFSRYYIQIIPRTLESHPFMNITEIFAIQTDGTSDSTSSSRHHSSGHLGSTGNADITRGGMYLKKCEVDAIKTNCEADEVCVATDMNSSEGFCVPDSLRSAILLTS